MSTVHLPELISNTFGTSRSEARRCIAQGAVKLDGKVTRDVDVPTEDLVGKVLTLGKRRTTTVARGDEITD